jgi:PAS domain S-box-containing protein
MQKGGLDAVQKVVGTDRGQELMEQIRHEADGMRTAEDNLLAFRAERSARSVRVKIATNIVGTLLGAAAVCLAFFLFQRRLAERRNAELSARAQARRASAISELGQRTLTDVGIASLEEKAVQLIADILDVPLVKVLELLPDGGTFRLRAGVGWREGLVGEATISAGLDSQAGYTLHASQPVVIGDLTTHAPVIVDDLRSESRFARPSFLLDHGVVSGISVIIYDQPDHPFGVLGAHTTWQRTFSDEEARFLQAVANVLAAAFQRRRAEEALRDSEQRFRALADSVPEIVWTSEPDGRCDYVNQRWHDFTGMTLEETVGFGWVSALKEDDVERSTDRWMHSVETGEPFDNEFRFRAKEGTYRWFLGRALPLRDAQGRIVKWFGNCMDIDEHKRMEQSLKDADRRKDEFLAMLAHELRNPLAPIRNGLEVLSRELGEKHEIVQLMQEQMEHVVRLVDDLLDVSRIVRGRIGLRMQPVELASIVYRAVSAVESMIGERGHELRISIPQDQLWVSADPVRLVQIIENLLNNAAKYTDPGGRIELQAERVDSELCLCVRDNGVGIDADLLPGVFDLFTQSSRSLDRSQGGLGIGLTLVRRLVESHGGSISAASDGPGKGSEFSVRLPLIEPPVESYRPTEGLPVSTAPRRILIVDDNAAAAKMLAMLLGHEDGQHQIETAHDGPAALRVMASFHPHLVLLDIGLPDMDGYEVAETIRKDPEFNDVLLVALTGYGQPDDVRKSREAGFDEHLVKPPALPDLQRLLVHPRLMHVPPAEPAHTPNGVQAFAGEPPSTEHTSLCSAAHELGNLAHVVRLAVHLLKKNEHSAEVQTVQELLEGAATSMGALGESLREAPASVETAETGG